MAETLDLTRLGGLKYMPPLCRPTTTTEIDRRREPVADLSPTMHHRVPADARTPRLVAPERFMRPYFEVWFTLE